MQECGYNRYISHQTYKQVIFDHKHLKHHSIRIQGFSSLDYGLPKSNHHSPKVMEWVIVSFGQRPIKLKNTEQPNLA